MAKKKAKAKAEVEETTAPVMDDVFLGGEEDDLMDMEYIQDEDTTTKVETHPPETEEEAALLAEMEPKDEEIPPEDEPKDEEIPPEDEPKDEEIPPEDEPKDIKVPKDRFDEVNDRMKKAEERADRLEQEIKDNKVEPAPEPEPDPYDYATKEKEAMEALLEGDTDSYTALRAEIRQAEKDETLREAKAIAESGDVQSREDISFEEAGAKIEADFPQFSTETDVYSAEAREEMLDLYVGYVQSGNYTRTQALQRAAASAARIYGYTATGTEALPDNVTEIGKKPVDVRRKAKIAENQPPEIMGKAENEDEQTLKINTMSDEQFDALPESTKRRMRGDTV